MIPREALPRPVVPLMRMIGGLALALLLACQPGPATVPEAPKATTPLQDPAWFGNGVQPSRHTLVDFAWAAPDLDLRGQAVELAPWEVPATPPTGIKADAAWIAKRDHVTQFVQALAAEGIALTQQMSIPAEVPPAYRVQGRVLAFDRQTRVAAKAGQIIGNIALVPVNLALLLLTNGHMNQLLFIGNVSGYRTEVLYQAKVVNLKTQTTVLALQSWMDFQSLQAPISLPATIWTLGGGEVAMRDWWPGQSLHEEDGDQVWFQPGLDLSGTRIRCLRWLPGPTLDAKVAERDLAMGLQATRMPRLLAAAERDGTGPALSETEGSLYLQGLCPGPEPWRARTCRVKLWDPATGQVVGLMQVSKGFWRSHTEGDWVRRIQRHLRNQVGPATGR